MKNGFLLIDKERGINSFKLVVAIRKLTNQKRVGFAGTLDPLASGLMIMALGEYTKLLPYLEAKDKVYLAEITLGLESNTYDAEGEIVKRDLSSYEKPDAKILAKIITQHFSGEIEQVPPKFSAIQINGKRAYDLARNGEDFELKSRKVEIFSCDVVGYDFPKLVLRIHCSSGTYIRSIANDLGKLLNCGGYLSDLKREKIGEISLANADLLKNFDQQNLQSKFFDPKLLFPNLKLINLSDQNYQTLAKGNFIDNEINLESDLALGIWGDQVVGVIESCEGQQKLKFKKKFNIF